MKYEMFTKRKVILFGGQLHIVCILPDQRNLALLGHAKIVPKVLWDPVADLCGNVTRKYTHPVEVTQLEIRHSEQSIGMYTDLDADASFQLKTARPSDRIRCRVLFARIRSEGAQMDFASLRTPFPSTRLGYPHVLTCQSISPSPLHSLLT